MKFGKNIHTATHSVILAGVLLCYQLQSKNATHAQEILDKIDKRICTPWKSEERPELPNQICKINIIPQLTHIKNIPKSSSNSHTIFPPDTRSKRDIFKKQ